MLFNTNNLNNRYRVYNKHFLPTFEQQMHKCLKETIASLLDISKQRYSLVPENLMIIFKVIKTVKHIQLEFLPTLHFGKRQPPQHEIKEDEGTLVSLVPPLDLSSADFKYFPPSLDGKIRGWQEDTVLVEFQ